MGVTRRAASNEKNTCTETVIPNCLKNCPAMPDMKLAGAKIAMMVRLMAMTARPISSAASMRRLIRRFAHPHVAHDIFDLDDRVVDQNAGAERNRQEADEVEREAQQIHHPERREDRQRQRDRGNNGCAQVAQEQEHHDHRERGAFEQRVDRSFVVAVGEIRPMYRSA